MTVVESSEQDAGINADWAFRRYEEIRPRLPVAPVMPERSAHAAHLGELAEEADVFVLDAFGVLNVGDAPVQGAPERIRELRRQGKKLFVLTNGATFGPEKVMQKFARFGFDFTEKEVISSRHLLCDGLSVYGDDHLWGIAALPESDLPSLPGRMHLLGDDPALYEQVDGFVLLSSLDWNRRRHNLMMQSLKRRPRPVLVGNPDLVAPRGDSFSLEPGYFVHELADETGIAPEFYGKPYINAFEEVRRRLSLQGIGVDGYRILMVGDTLHTDILGGAAAGFRTVLVTDLGLFKGRDVAAYIENSGIVPDFIIPRT